MCVIPTHEGRHVFSLPFKVAGQLTGGEEQNKSWPISSLLALLEDLVDLALESNVVRRASKCLGCEAPASALQKVVEWVFQRAYISLHIV